MLLTCDDFLTKEEVAEFRRLIDESLGDKDLLPSMFCNDAAAGIAARFWSSHKEVLSTVGCKEISPYVSLSKSARNVDWHRDVAIDGETHKLLVYLDGVAGTQFRNADGTTTHIWGASGRADDDRSCSLWMWNTPVRKSPSRVSNTPSASACAVSKK